MFHAPGTLIWNRLRICAAKAHLEDKLTRGQWRAVRADVDSVLTQIATPAVRCIQTTGTTAEIQH